jgi:hypothetical protein
MIPRGRDGLHERVSMPASCGREGVQSELTCPVDWAYMMSSSGLSRKATASRRRWAWAKSSFSVLGVEGVGVSDDALGCLNGSRNGSAVTYRPFPNRNLAADLASLSLRLPSEPSPVRYGSLPRAWRSRICGVNSLLAMEDDGPGGAVPPGVPGMSGLLVWCLRDCVEMGCRSERVGQMPR